VRRFLRFLIWVAVSLGVLVGIARAVVLRWWRVPLDDPYLEASVSPTLRGGDLILLWRLTKPSYGDLVMCPEPRTQTPRVVIARILGEAGDTISIRGDEIRVNGKPGEVERDCARPKFATRDPDTHDPVEQPCRIEAVGSHEHMRGGVGNHAPPAPFSAEKVPPGYVFLVSDNRLFPYDSRYFGTVERASCRETVFFRLVGKGGFFDAKTRFTYIQ
jgi:signal peptidase I